MQKFSCFWLSCCLSTVTYCFIQLVFVIVIVASSSRDIRPAGIPSGVLLLIFVREKSWSVKLLRGYVLKNQVRSDRCVNCNSVPKLVAGNNGKKDLLLYGCGGQKCRHIMIRVNFFQGFPTSLDLKPLTSSPYELGSVEAHLMANTAVASTA